ncbi:MAG: NADH-quinone oxidoreductase subunit NuoH [Anaerolineae bacterium]
MNLFGLNIDPVLVDLVVIIIKSVVLIVALLTIFAYVQLVERRVIARIQVRIGPNRTGPFGLLQPVADAIKAIFKEEVVPAGADRLLFIIAPGLSVVTALIAFAVIPLGPPIDINGYKLTLYIADVNIAVLYVLAIGSLSVYGIVLAGWSSNNKYALLGALRSAAQLVSYEISLGLALVGVLMLSGSLSLTQIINYQDGTWLGVIPRWNIFIQPIGFIIYFIGAMAETNRLPFDLPEAETELIAGYHIEYSSIKFAFFFMAEYINIITVSAIAATLFLGGYLAPFGILPGPWWLVIKIALLIFVFMWIRGTFPRLRYDQLMNLGWKVMLPLALLNILITAGEILIPSLTTVASR